MWLVFVYNVTTPQGGVGDLHGSFTTEDQCQQSIREFFATNSKEEFEAHYCQADNAGNYVAYDATNDVFNK